MTPKKLRHIGWIPWTLKGGSDSGVWTPLFLHIQVNRILARQSVKKITSRSPGMKAAVVKVYAEVP